jgi:hypothetical protein
MCLDCDVCVTHCVLYIFLGECLMLDGNVAPVCVCDHGFEGLSCDSCVTHFTGTSCEMCEDGYIGYNTTCSVLCLHGHATKLGRSCKPFNKGQYQVPLPV